MKKILAGFLALCMALTLSAPMSVNASGQYSDSGSLSMSKMSQEEIIQLLEDNPTTTPSPIYAQVPSSQYPYSAGALSSELLSAMTGRLNAMRRIAGLPAVENDQSFNENAQYGAVLVAASGRISHSPKQPDDMDDAFYERGLRAVSSLILPSAKSALAIAMGSQLKQFMTAAAPGVTMTLFPGRLPEISRKICLDGTRHGVLR